MTKLPSKRNAKREAKIAAAQENLTVIERALMSERELAASLAED